MLLTPPEVWPFALFGVIAAQQKYDVGNPIEMAKWLTSLAFQESCLNKGAPEQRCFDTDARPYNAKTKKYLSSALGLTQVLKGTQHAIETLMGWPARSDDARSDPLYAMQLTGAYMGYFYNGGAKTPKANWYAALVAYHDGHYSKGGAGQSYAQKILRFKNTFDWDVIRQAAAGATAGIANALEEYAQRVEFR